MTTSAPAAPAPVADTAASGTPAPSAPSAPAAPPSTPNADPAAPAAPPAPGTDPAAPQAPTEYKIPEAFKDKPWASKIKSDEDLWKALDGAQTLIGKKHAPIDPTKATPQQLEEYKAAHRPADIAEYKFNDDVPEEERQAIGKMLYDEGIPAWQANKIIENYTAMEAAQVAKLYDKDEYMAVMKESFGDEHLKTVGRVQRALDKLLSPEDKSALEHTPNVYLATIYRAVNTILEKYGVEDTGAGGGTPPGQQEPTDVAAESSAILKQIQALEANPHHSAEEKQALINKRQALIDKKHGIRR